MRQIFAAVLILLAKPQAPQTSARCLETWSYPKTLRAPDGRPAYVEAPVAVSDRAATLVFGTPSFLWVDTTAFDPPPSRTTLDTARYISRLRSNHGFIGFRLDSLFNAIPMRPWFSGFGRNFVAAKGANGTVHLIWSAPPNGWSMDSADATIWYSELSKGKWSRPKLIYEADRLDWSGHKPSMLIRADSRSSSQVHVVVSYYRHNTNGVAYIRRLNGEWKRSETAFRGLPSAATAELFGSDSIAIAYAGIGADGARGRNGQHIYLIRASIRDTKPLSARLIEWLGRDNVRWMGLYAEATRASNSSRLNLVWTRLRENATSDDTVYVRRSSDSGNSWSKAETLHLPFRSGHVASTRDTQGNIHLALLPDRANRATDKIFHAVLSRRGWVDLYEINTGPVATPPSLFSHQGNLMLIWGSARQASPGNPFVVAPVSRYSTYRPRCPSNE